MERKRLYQSLRKPTRQQSARVRGKGQQRQHQDASQDSCRRQEPERIDCGCFDGVDLFGHFHRRQLGANAGAYAAANNQPGDNRTHYLNDGVNERSRKH